MLSVVNRQESHFMKSPSIASLLDTSHGLLHLPEMSSSHFFKLCIHLFFYLLDVFKIDFGTQSKLSRQFLSVINAYLQGKIDYLKIKISRQSNF